MKEDSKPCLPVVATTKKSQSIFSCIADLSLKELLVRLVQSQHLMQISTEAGEASNETRLHFLLHFIHENLAEKISIDALSRKAYMSRNTFFKWFKEQFWITPLEYINRERIKLAKQILSGKESNVSDVGYQCGFTYVNYFVRLFKKAEGITPRAYKGYTKFG
jgi:AraC-like DNA-binding protein